jgi:glyoxylate/hydroxypyruvate reductase A
VKLLVATTSNPERWYGAFAARFPDAVARWPDAPPEVDYLVAWKPDPEVFRRVRVRRAMFNLGAGVEATLALPTLPPDLTVIRLEDAGMAAQMADYVSLAVLAAFREAGAYAREQAAGRWTQRPPRRKDDFAVGVLGAGVLGQAVGRAVAALGFPVMLWGRTPRAVGGLETYAGDDALDRVLARAQVLVGLLPSTPETRGLLDAARLARLPRGAQVVNVGRGDLIVDEALLAALDAGHLASATLDVFRTEPLPAAHPFWHHPSITLTPHVSAATLFDVSADQVAFKIAALERGEAVGGVVDRARGY